MRRIEPFEETARMESILARSTWLGGKCSVRKRYDTGMEIVRKKNKSISNREGLRIADSTFHNALEMQRNILLEHCKCFENQPILFGISQGIYPVKEK